MKPGNSHYKESIRRYNQMKEAGIHLIDAGTSRAMEPVLWREVTLRHGRLQGRCFGILPSKTDIFTLVKRGAAIFKK